MRDRPLSPPLASLFPAAHRPHPERGGGRREKGGTMSRRPYAGPERRTELPPGGFLRGRGCCDDLLSVPAALGPDTTHCVRPQAFRGSLAEAHPSDTRFPEGRPGTVAAASTRLLHQLTPPASATHCLLCCAVTYSGVPVAKYRLVLAAGPSSCASNRGPSLPPGRCPFPDSATKPRGASVPARRCRCAAGGCCRASSAGHTTG